jgi:hypothetical protein
MSTEIMPGDAVPAHETPAHGTPGRNAWIKRTWTTIVTWVRREPAAAQAIILAFIAIGVTFQWWQWTNSQTGAVFGIAAALLGMFVRSQVMPLVQPAATGRRPVPATDEPDAAARGGGQSRR